MNVLRKDLHHLGKSSEGTIISLPPRIARDRILELMSKVPYFGLMLGNNESCSFASIQSVWVG